MSREHPRRDPCSWGEFTICHRGTDHDSMREPRRASAEAIASGNARRKIEERRLLADIAGRDYWEVRG